MSERKIWLEEAPIDATPLAGDRYSIWSTELSSGQIETLEDVQSIVNMGDDKSIIVVPRSQIAPGYLESIESSFTTTYPSFTSIPKAAYFTYWHPTRSSSAHNALPHVHTHDNIHAALRPSKQPTVFFSRRAVEASLTYLSTAENIQDHLRIKLLQVLGFAKDAPLGYANALFDALVDIFHKERSPGTIDFVQAIQSETRSRAGLIEIPLTANAYGMVVIPRDSVHSRGVLNDFVRDDALTAWRYFRRDSAVS